MRHVAPGLVDFRTPLSTHPVTFPSDVCWRQESIGKEIGGEGKKSEPLSSEASQAAGRATPGAVLRAVGESRLAVGGALVALHRPL